MNPPFVRELGMRNILCAALLSTALVVAFGSAAAIAGRQGPAVGGYKAVAKDDPEVNSAARFAVAAQGRKENGAIRLISVEAAERQTVAGANYRLCLKVEIEDTVNNVDVTESVRVLVFRSLKREYTLKSWEVDDCAEDD